MTHIIRGTQQIHRSQENEGSPGNLAITIVFNGSCKQRFKVKVLPRKEVQSVCVCVCLSELQYLIYSKTVMTQRFPE